MLKIRGMSKSYGKQAVIKNIHLSLKPGVCFGIVGPNGAGKSTWLKIIAGIIQADEGRITYKKDMSIGYIPQDICLEEQLTAKVNLMYFGKLYGLGGEYLKKRVTDILELVGLSHRANERVKNFSGGMKRRLHIACGLIHEPSLILMDEPTVGVDPQSRQAIFDLLDVLREEGKTIIYASHYMEEVEQLCDEVAFIDEGKIVEQGHLDDLLQEYSQEQVFVKGIKDLPVFPEGTTIQKKDGGYVIASSNAYQIMMSLLEKGEKEEEMMDRLELVHTRLADIFFRLTGRDLRE